MLDVALRRPDGSTVVDPALLRTRAAPALPVAGALRPVLPGGLRRGTTISVSGSLSLLLAAVGAASAEGAWVALVGFPLISAEAALGHGIDLGRLALVPDPGPSWSTAVGALLDAVDIVAVRPPGDTVAVRPPGDTVAVRRRNRLAPGDVRRLAARARTRQAVLMPFLTGSATWPGADLRLRAAEAHWHGADNGHGRLRQRRLTVSVEGRGTAARPLTAELWLPTAAGATAPAAPAGAVAREPAHGTLVAIA